ncbi:Low-density lipoprotein receptor-related protein 2 [Nymphon striatum]|nr:Low-density lipoprotein receptor-related protein 2 [Nymphon striatum]
MIGFRGDITDNANVEITIYNHNDYETTCTPTQYKCKNNKCIPHNWLCDGGNDCGDSSDEEQCTTGIYSCPYGKYRCRNYKCIPNNWVCDGRNDCGDYSDEDHCGTSTEETMAETTTEQTMVFTRLVDIYHISFVSQQSFPTKDGSIKFDQFLVNQPNPQAYY